MHLQQHIVSLSFYVLRYYAVLTCVLSRASATDHLPPSSSVLYCCLLSSPAVPQTCRPHFCLQVSFQCIYWLKICALCHSDTVNLTSCSTADTGEGMIVMVKREFRLPLGTEGTLHLSTGRLWHCITIIIIIIIIMLKETQKMWQVTYLSRSPTLCYPHLSCHMRWGTRRSQPVRQHWFRSFGSPRGQNLLFSYA